MAITINNDYSEVYLENFNTGQSSFLKYIPSSSSIQDPPPPVMCTALANLEHGNHVIDPANAPCSVYPPNSVKMNGWEAQGQDGTYLTSLNVVYYNKNNNNCQLNATTNYLTATSFSIYFNSGILCNGNYFNNTCCGPSPLTPCSSDSTFCWFNPYSCKDYINLVCCF